MQSSVTAQIEEPRDFSLDWISGLLILHMIIGHIAGWVGIDYVVNQILFFFMPWFFFKGGCFINTRDGRQNLTRVSSD